MSETPTSPDFRAAQIPPLSERVVYVLPELSSKTGTDEVSLRELWMILWHRRWLVIAVTSIFTLGSMSYALMATEWYRVEVLLAPSEKPEMSALGGQLGGLAALAGFGIGDRDSTEALATLESRGFADAFIQDLGLVPVFFAHLWDADTKQWLEDDPKKWPDSRDAIKYFHDSVLGIREDRQTGLVTLSVEWTDPEIAAKWAEALVQRLNIRLRERAQREAATNIAYLQGELAQTSLVTLQQSIGRLLEVELQKLMLARGNEEFAFRVIDAAAIPKERTRPNRALICMLGTLVGGMLASFGVFLAHAFRAETQE